MHVRIGRSMDATALASSFILPSTINEHYSLTSASSRTRNHSWYEKGTFAEERKRRKASTRLVYFWGHFAPDSRWTCWIYHRKSLAREQSLRTLFCPFLFLQRVHPQQPPRFQTSSRAPELQHLWEQAWRCLRGHAWCSAKKLCIPKMSTRKCFQENTTL